MIVCGVFIDLQKAFNTIDHNILLEKIQYYSIRRIAHQWHESYLRNRKQFTFVNRAECEISYLNYDVPQGSVLGPLLILININDFRHAIKVSLSLHVADNTCLLKTQSSIEQINRTLKTACLLWLNANKISLNVLKTEVILFKSKSKQLDTELKHRSCRK